MYLSFTRPRTACLLLFLIINSQVYEISCTQKENQNENVLSFLGKTPNCDDMTKLKSAAEYLLQLVSKTQDHINSNEMKKRTVSALRVTANEYFSSSKRLLEKSLENWKLPSHCSLEPDFQTKSLSNLLEVESSSQGIVTMTAEKRLNNRLTIAKATSWAGIALAFLGSIILGNQFSAQHKLSFWESTLVERMEYVFGVYNKTFGMKTVLSFLSSFGMGSFIFVVGLIVTLKAAFLFPSVQAKNRLSDHAFLSVETPFEFKPSSSEIKISPRAMSNSLPAYIWEVSAGDYSELNIKYARNMTEIIEQPYIGFYKGFEANCEPEKLVDFDTIVTKSGDQAKCFNTNRKKKDCQNKVTFSDKVLTYKQPITFTSGLTKEACKNELLRIVVFSSELASMRVYYLFSPGCSRFYSPRDYAFKNLLCFALDKNRFPNQRK